MVHALEEALRVVTSDGCVLDLRPLAFDLPFEVETPGGVEQIGYVPAAAPGLAADFACLRAERTAGSQRLLTRDEVRYLTFALYWKTQDELSAFLAEHWQCRRLAPARESVENAGRLLASSEGTARICAREILRLARFRKPNRLR
jgi:hypothetical protein